MPAKPRSVGVRIIAASSRSVPAGCAAVVAGPRRGPAIAASASQRMRAIRPRVMVVSSSLSSGAGLAGLADDDESRGGAADGVEVLGRAVVVGRDGADVDAAADDDR